MSDPQATPHPNAFWLPLLDPNLGVGALTLDMSLAEL